MLYELAGIFSPRTSFLIFLKLQNLVFDVKVNEILPQFKCGNAYEKTGLNYQTSVFNGHDDSPYKCHCDRSAGNHFRSGTYLILKNTLTNVFKRHDVPPSKDIVMGLFRASNSEGANFPRPNHPNNFYSCQQ